MDFSDYLRAILNARIYDLVVETPLEPAPKSSARVNHEVLLKREDQQKVFSFKLRGAYNKLLQLTEAQRARGVLAVSAGNHAQGVALAAKHLGISATIVMPQTTPSIKVEAVTALGATVQLHGDSFDDAASFGRTLADQQGLSWVHPYDDADVIAGQGTIAMELLRQRHDLGAIFVPVGGGGLIAGIAAWVKTLRPEVKIIAVEPDDAASLAAALEAGRPVALAHVGLFVDGVAVKQVGAEPFRIAKSTVDACVQVSADEVCAGIRDMFEETRTVVEPAGALALAGIKRYLADPARPAIAGAIVAIVCGANMNFDRLRHVAERAQIGEQHEAVFGVQIPEHRGSFLEFCQALGKRNITEFNYRMRDGAHADVFVGIALRQGIVERAQIQSQLQERGYAVSDYSDNEAAKLHVRHLVGGRALAQERLYRFEFPERPGALMEFLTALSARWSISLFHYRNHGAAYGRVLLGLIVQPSELEALHVKFDAIGFTRVDESENAALRQFLGAS